MSLEWHKSCPTPLGTFLLGHGRVLPWQGWVNGWTQWSAGSFTASVTVWDSACCCPTGFPLGSLLRTQPQKSPTPRLTELKAASSAALQGRLQEGAFGTGWRTGGQLHLGAVLVQHWQFGVCIPAFVLLNINLVPLQRSHLAKAPLRIYCPEESTNDIPNARVICVAPQLDFGDCATLKDNSQPKITYMMPTSLLPFPSSCPEPCSLKMAHPLLFYSVFNGFWTSKRGEKTLSLQHAAKYYAATLLKNTYKTRC